MPIEPEKEKTNMNELERKPYSSESMRVRCPHCRKLYLVQFSDIQEAKPRFECVQCHERFWISMSDMDLTAELQGLPVQLKESPVNGKAKIRRPAAQAKSMEPCPKCFKIVETGTAECPACGVLINKIKEMAFTEDNLARSETLATAWKKVVANYASDEAHADFLRLAQRERNLPFAAVQYGRMQKLMPSDEVTRKKLNEVQALGSVMIDKPHTKMVMGRTSRLWQVPLMASVLMMIVGTFVPMFRNMVGVGAAFFFLALAVQIQFRRRNT